LVLSFAMEPAVEQYTHDDDDDDALIYSWWWWWWWLRRLTYTMGLWERMLEVALDFYQLGPGEAILLQLLLQLLLAW
jgi:hypothetical protein